VALVGYVDARRTDAADPRSADGASLERLEQDGALPGVLRGDGNHAGQRDLVLELIDVGGWRHDRRRQSQDVETSPVRSGIVPHQNDVGLTKRRRRILLAIVPP